MEALKWTEQEQRTYADLFAVCDVENTGKVSGIKASELFLTSGLPQEILHQITEVCGAKRLGHFGRVQFYVALKFIAAAQCGLPIGSETFNAGFDIPLAKFGHQLQQEVYTTDRGHCMPGTHGHPTSAIRPPPKHNRQNSQNVSRVIPGYDAHQPMHDQRDSPGEPTSPPFSPKDSPTLTGPPLSPNLTVDSHMAARVDAPTHHPATASYQHTTSHPAAQPHPTQQHNAAQVPSHLNSSNPGYMPGYVNNHVGPAPGPAEPHWASFEEDSRGLLTEEPKSHQWAHFSDAGGSDMRGETSSITSSEAESIDDVWMITEEQRQYYTNQFLVLQPDLTAVIGGAAAKEFFEKSRLPQQELAKIWQLSDVNRDGALSLDEFCIAMHLVVLRRNDIELPEDLPTALIPYEPMVNVDPAMMSGQHLQQMSMSTEEPFASDLPPGSLKSITPTSPPPQQWHTDSFPPETPDSSVSSPNQKPTPVNFEFQPVALDPDSKIIHPVPLRMSPEGVPPGLSEPTEIKKPRAYSGSHIQDGIASRHPPPGKPPDSSTQTGPSTDAASHLGSTKSFTAPPAVPPRHSEAGHKKLVTQASEPAFGGHPAGTVPASFADFRHPDVAGSAGAGDAMDGGTPAGATAECENPADQSGSQEYLSADELDNKPKQLSKQESQDKREMIERLRKQRTKNLTLSRLNNELNQELQEVMEHRIALEIQLEHLRPFTS